jgi:hypothetical protein
MEHTYLLFSCGGSITKDVLLDKRWQRFGAIAQIGGI